MGGQKYHHQELGSTFNEEFMFNESKTWILVFYKMFSKTGPLSESGQGCSTNSIWGYVTHGGCEQYSTKTE